MNENATNPYSTPEADVVPDSLGGDAFADFPRFSAWWVALLSIITYGLYTYYWLVTRTTKINQALPDFQISAGLLWATISLGLLNIVLSIWFEIGLGSATPEILGTVALASVALGLVQFVCWVMLAFAIRSRLNRMTGATPGHPLWSNGVLTFFFTPIYPAYKINQAKDAHAIGA
ncbi:MAG: DUF4234 domain-containing protein [Pseudomonadota bacterium]